MRSSGKSERPQPSGGAPAELSLEQAGPVPPWSQSPGTRVVAGPNATALRDLVEVRGRAMCDPTWTDRPFFSPS